MDINVEKLNKMFLSSKEVALIFGMSVRVVQRKAKEGCRNFPRGYYIGDGKRPMLRFKVEDVKKYINDYKPKEDF